MPPNNASLALPATSIPTRPRPAERYFGDSRRDHPCAHTALGPSLTQVQLTLEDRVQLQRNSTSPGLDQRASIRRSAVDILVAILAEGRSSRLYRSLVYDNTISRDVTPASMHGDAGKFAWTPQ